MESFLFVPFINPGSDQDQLSLINHPPTPERAVSLADNKGDTQEF